MQTKQKKVVTNLDLQEMENQAIDSKLRESEQWLQSIYKINACINLYCDLQGVPKSETRKRIQLRLNYARNFSRRSPFKIWEIKYADRLAEVFCGLSPEMLAKISESGRHYLVQEDDYREIARDVLRLARESDDGTRIERYTVWRLRHPNAVVKRNTARKNKLRQFDIAIYRNKIKVFEGTIVSCKKGMTSGKLEKFFRVGMKGQYEHHLIEIEVIDITNQ